MVDLTGLEAIPIALYITHKVGIVVITNLTLSFTGSLALSSGPHRQNQPSKNPPFGELFDGGPDRTRTCHLLGANEAL
jgi:hypothetical protein